MLYIFFKNDVILENFAKSQHAAVKTKKSEVTRKKGATYRNLTQKVQDAALCLVKQAFQIKI